MKLKILLIALMVALPVIVQSATPDFGQIKDVKQKKKAFFNYMYPLILAENKKILVERAIVKSNKKSAQLTKICQKYSKNCENIDSKKRKNLLKRVDVIPPSLAMAQGANESAWGTSRFAKKGNNFFGQWCYTKGCGIIPKKRDKGTKHEVRRFSNPQQSVGAYIFNLNTGRVYSLIRNQRVAARTKSTNPNGYELAKGLIKYSQRREAYVKEIRSMISYNKLVKKYDQKFWRELNQ
ncbi:MAG: Bax protein [Urechidicola sp.]|jgi:Bax protein